MKLRMILFALLLTTVAALTFTSATFSFADGTDPMPFCRGKNCK